LPKGKSWTEKLLDNKGLPQVQKITDKMSKRWGSGTVVIPAPLEVDELMRKVPEGKVTTINEIRAALAKKHGATIGCPITTGIFAWIAANAAEEKRQKGEKFKIIDPANLPEEPYKPDRLRIALMGIVIGTGIGAGLAFLLEFLNPAFIKPEDFAGILTQPVLATIPVFPEKAPNKLGKRFMVLNGRQR